MNNLIEIKKLLLTADKLRQKSEAEELSRGESFNVFSVLKMERNETRTHSAFIAELLNPKGTHKCGSRFLKFFIEPIEHINNFNYSNANVHVEYYIGPVDYDKQMGGYLDILISDGNQNVIIENKIDAGDQHSQLVRYSKFRRRDNHVLYLTTEGGMPSDISVKVKDGHLLGKDILEENKDYHNISYRKHIVEWLDECLNVVEDNQFLKANIRQYQLLILKITNTMEDNFAKDFSKLLLENATAAKLIKDNYDVYRHNLGEAIKEEVKDALSKELKVDTLKDPYAITNVNTGRFTTLEIRPENIKHLCYKIESFSGDGHYDGKLFIGILNPHIGFTNTILGDQKSEFGGYWIGIKLIEDLDQCSVNLSDGETIQKLFTEPAFRQQFIAHITNSILIYIQENMEYINQLDGSLDKLLND